MTQGKKNTEKWLAVQCNILDPFVRNLWKQSYITTPVNESGKFTWGNKGKHFVIKSLFTTPSNVLPLQLKQTFPPIIWIFTEGERDGIEFRLLFKIFSTLIDFFQNWNIICHFCQKLAKSKPFYRFKLFVINLQVLLLSNLLNFLKYL